MRDNILVGIEARCHFDQNDLAVLHLEYRALRHEEDRLFDLRRISAAGGNLLDLFDEFPVFTFIFDL